MFHFKKSVKYSPKMYDIWSTFLWWRKVIGWKASWARKPQFWKINSPGGKVISQTVNSPGGRIVCQVKKKLLEICLVGQISMLADELSGWESFKLDKELSCWENSKSAGRPSWWEKWREKPDGKKNSPHIKRWSDQLFAEWNTILFVWWSAECRRNT